MAAKQNNITTTTPPTKQLFLKFYDLPLKQIDYLINKEFQRRDMARPRKAPAQILTANIPLTTWDKLDDLRLVNRSAWLNRVILDELAREQENIDLHASRTAAIKKDVALMSDPAKFIAKIPNRTLLLAALARINYDKKRLRGDLVAFISSLDDDEMKMTQMPKDQFKMEYVATIEEVNKKLEWIGE